ncbi:hypothetical protein ACFYRC_05950 [Streptomyces sp. NPDC005279]
MSDNPLADAVGELTDAQLRRIVALMGLRQLPEEADARQEDKAAA